MSTSPVKCKLPRILYNKEFTYTKGKVFVRVLSVYDEQHIVCLKELASSKTLLREFQETGARVELDPEQGKTATVIHRENIKSILGIILLN